MLPISLILCLFAAIPPAKLRFLLLAVALGTGPVAGADWVRAGVTTNAAVWGRTDGLQWAVPPAGFRGGEPRGLIRLGYPVLSNGGCDLINFIAIEPVVAGRRGFSELERSRLDDRPGLRIWAGRGTAGAPTTTSLVAGTIRRLTHGAEQLEVPLHVERFANGAHVRLRVRQRSDQPDELEFSVHAEPDSARIESCILTATMGNFARLRRLWLRDEVVASTALYPDYRGVDFAPPTVFALGRLHRTPVGDVLVAATTDEEDPATIFPFPGSEGWHYGGAKVTQYWCEPVAEILPVLAAAVNARHTYWQSQQPIPGGIAFENFELRAPFREGQRFIFGITRKTPEELGFKASPAPENSRRR